jgi:hypothetical protein
MRKLIIAFTATLAIAGAVFAASSAADAYNCTTTCYGSGSYRTCNTSCF